MSDRSLTSLESRIAALETANHRLKLFASLLTIVPLIAITAAWNSGRQSVEFETISAKEILVVDDAGNPLVRLDQAANGGRLSILGSGGRMAVVAGSTEHGGILTTNTTDGSLAAAIGSDSSGRGTIGLHDSANMPSISLGIEDSGNGYLSVNNRQGQELAIVGTSEEGFGIITTLDSRGREMVVLSRYLESGYIGAFGQNGAPLFGLGTFGQGGGGMVIFGPDGKRISSLGRGAVGTGVLGMFNEDGNLTAEISANAGGGMFNTYDGEGGITGTLPGPR